MATPIRHQVPTVDAVERLTDEAIKKRLKALERQMETRYEKMTELQGEIDTMKAECVTLRKAQIARIQAQIPDEEQS